MQLSVKDMFRAGGNNKRTGAKCKFVDLFCGCGGASTGAKNAGYEVVLAVDSWSEGLEVHQMNHPESTHMCLVLPPENELPFPDHTEVWHLHGSPPCTRVSIANQERDPEEREKAIDLVKWYIELAKNSTATSWSMEQVATPIVLDCLEYFKKLWKSQRFDYEVFDFYDLGVPQHRRRVIAGSADVVSRLRRVGKWHRHASSVLLHPRGTHIRNYMKNSNPKPDPEGRVKWVYKHYSNDEACKPLSGPSPVVIAGQSLRWATPYTNTKLVLFTPSEMALLQCFPKDYILHENTRISMRCVGNALPPIIMFQMLTGTKPVSHLKRKRIHAVADPESPCYNDSSRHLGLFSTV